MTTEQAAGLTPVPEPDNSLDELFSFNNKLATGTVVKYASKATLRDTVQPFQVTKVAFKKNQPKYKKSGEFVDEYHLSIKYNCNETDVEEVMSLESVIKKDGTPSARNIMLDALGKAAKAKAPGGVGPLYVFGGGSGEGYKLSNVKPVKNVK